MNHQHFRPWTCREPLSDPPFESGDAAGQRWAITTTTNDGHLVAAVDSLQREFPRISLAFLAQSDLADFLRQSYPAADIIHAPRNGFFGIDLTTGLVRRLRRARFDRLVILYRTEDGSQHKRAELLALLSGSRQIYGLDVLGRWWRIPRRYLIRGALRPLLQSKPAKVARTLFYNITFAFFLAGQALLIRLLSEPRDKRRI